MTTLPPILPLLFTVGALLSGLLLWGFWQTQQPDNNQLVSGSSDDFIWWLSLLAVFTLGLFLLFLFFSFRFHP